MSLCDSIDTLAMAYLDDELATEERHELETHLTECTSCRAHVDGGRADQALLRNALAAPRASDSMKMRLSQALDVADREAVRAEHKRWSQWVLPGSAIMAAAAALLVFVGVGSKSPAPVHSLGSVAKDAVRQQARPLPFEVEGPSTGQWVQQHADMAVPTINQPGSKLLGARLLPYGINHHDAVALSYQVSLKNRPFALSVLVVQDVKADEMEDGEEVQVGDRTMHVVESEGRKMVTYVDVDHLGYMFMAPDIAVNDLVQLVGRTSLVGPQ